MVAAVGFALLGWKVPVMVTTVIGLPVLFGVYLRQIDLSRSIPGRFLAMAGVFAVGLGVGWELVAGPMVDDAYYAEIGGQLTAGQLFMCGVVIPITYAVVLVAPAALVRALDRSSAEALDGFTIGAVGATIVNAAATATLLVPQVMAGTAGSRPTASLLIALMVEGVAWPLGSVAAGGMFGLALWFTPSSTAPRGYRRIVVIPAAFLGALVFSIVMGFVDVAAIPRWTYVALQLPIILGAVLAVRTAVADALLHEATDDTVDGTLLCAECDHVVATAAFCSECGVAIGATSRTSRAARRVLPEQSDEGKHQRTASYRTVLGPVISGVGIAVAAAVVMAGLAKPDTAAYVCPPACGRPPLGNPVETYPRFSGDDGAFSVAYPDEGSAYEVTLDPPGMEGVQARYVGGDTGLLNLFGEPARDRTATQIVDAVIKSKFPGATVDYEIPNASVGYEPGYGVVADLYARDARLRVIVMAAVRHDYALIATAAGPYHEFSPDYGTGHPSGANLELAMDMGKYVNSFRWSGDRHRRPS
ncbi:MAG: zinc ribbon domain-containing protein [Mycobacterium sp.]